MPIKTEAPKKKTAKPKLDQQAADQLKTAEQPASSNVKSSRTAVENPSMPPSSASPSAGMLKIKQVKSPIGRHTRQRQTLIGLGLNKLHRVSIVKDTPSVRGMMTVVAHLIKIEID
jgi:large subunit ribosomal protein L30